MERKGKERKGKERKKERKGMEWNGMEWNGKERKGKERKGKERKYIYRRTSVFDHNPFQKAGRISICSNTESIFPITNNVNSLNPFQDIRKCYFHLKINIIILT